MDPEQTLAEMRELAQAIMEDRDAMYLNETAPALAEKFQALDDWLTARGFLPADWAHPQPVPGTPFTSPTAEELAAMEATIMVPHDNTPSEEEMAEIEAASNRAWEAARAEGKIDG